MLIESLEVGAIHYTNKDGIRKVPHEVMFSLYTGRAFSIDENGLLSYIRTMEFLLKRQTMIGMVWEPHTKTGG